MGTTSEKLTYLNDTKQLLKENINSLGGNLTTEPFRQYASVLEGIYERIPKVSGIGTSLSLSPTMVGKIKLNEIQGNTLQDVTPTPSSPVPIQSVTGLQNVNITSKNLKDENNIFNGYLNDTEGIVSNNNNRITYIQIESNKTYNIKKVLSKRFRIGLTNSIPSNNLAINNYASLDNQTSYTFTNTNYKYLCVWFWTNQDTLTEQQVLDSINIYTDSNTYEVNLGKNLFDKDNITTGKRLYYWQGTADLIDDANYCVSDYIKIKPNATYTINLTMSAYTRMIFFDNNKSPLSPNETNATFTTPNNTAYVRLSVPLNQLDTTQLEKGQSTSYSPYFTPIELCKIGDYEDSIKKSTGKNLFDKNNANILNAYFDEQTITITSEATNKTIYIPCKTNTTYTITKYASSYKRSIAYTTEEPNIGVQIYDQVVIPSNGTTGTITTGNNAKYLVIRLMNTSQDSSVSVDQMLSSVMINEGSTALPYEPYGKVWYVEKNIGKVDFGTLSWTTYGHNVSGYKRYTTTGITNIKYVSSNTQLGDGLAENYQNHTGSGMSGQGAINCFAIDTAQVQAVDLEGSTPTGQFCYALNTPEYTTITNTELINQLESIKSQEGTTNISITSENLPMIINASALKGDVE